MKNYALLDENNKVVNISVANEDWDSTGWIEYTENNPAFVGGDYFENIFYPPKLFTSWTRSDGTWQPPTPKPEDGKLYYWDEPSLSWIEITPTE